MTTPKPGELWRFTKTTETLIIVVKVEVNRFQDEGIVRYIRLYNPKYEYIGEDTKPPEIFLSTFLLAAEKC